MQWLGKEILEESTESPEYWRREEDMQKRHVSRQVSKFEANSD